MTFIRVSILSLILLVVCEIDEGHAATRVYFSKCAKNGFTCVTNANKKIDMVYECQNGVDNVIIYTNQFSAPSNIENLKIQKCKILTISTRCTSEIRPIQKLQVINIGHLIIARQPFTPMLPPTVVFENISLIDVIPTQTFGQINKPFYSVGCYAQTFDFQSVYFRNVAIDTVQTNAFVALNKFRNFSFINVKIKRIQTAGIQLNHDLTGQFEMRNCVVDAIEYLGIQVYGRRAVISDNNFTEISSSAINGTMEDFYFTKNFVETLQPHGFSVLATNIFILDNDFLHLKSLALEKLSPGLLQDSRRNFGKLKFVYDFSKNALNFLDAGSLHPDYVSYENVQTEMMFSRNKFLCSCENLGWLFSSFGQGPNTALVESFYEMVLDDSYGNICDKPYGKPCDLPLRLAGQMIECGKCLKNVTLDVLCNKLFEIPSTSTTEEEDVTFEIMSVMNYTMVSKATTAQNLSPIVKISMLITIYVLN